MNRVGMLLALALALGLGLVVAQASTPASAPEGTEALRCGWFDNPSPGNAWLHDRHGEWTIGIQGAHQARGQWPAFPRSSWARTGSGSAGYGCVCLRVRADADARLVTHIVSAKVRPLAACRSDAAIKDREPANPLK